jgi:hypothetical protein
VSERRIYPCCSAHHASHCGGFGLKMLFPLVGTGSYPQFSERLSLRATVKASLWRPTNFVVWPEQAARPDRMRCVRWPEEGLRLRRCVYHEEALNLIHVYLCSWGVHIDAYSVRDCLLFAWPGISSGDCFAKGCCYDDSRVGTIWCFQPAGGR